MNGFAFHGLFKISGSTFLVFVDYLRATTRVASLSELNRVSYILTHDSIGVGEDGPTHQPVETVSGLRVIPNLDVTVQVMLKKPLPLWFLPSLAKRDQLL